mgnify:CR=1 FL=1
MICIDQCVNNMYDEETDLIAIQAIHRAVANKAMDSFLWDQSGAGNGFEMEDVRREWMDNTGEISVGYEGLYQYFYDYTLLSLSGVLAFDVYNDYYQYITRMPVRNTTIGDYSYAI